MRPILAALLASAVPVTADAQAAAPTSPAAATTAPAAEGSYPYQWLEEWTTPRVM